MKKIVKDNELLNEITMLVFASNKVIQTLSKKMQRNKCLDEETTGLVNRYNDRFDIISARIVQRYSGD